MKRKTKNWVWCVILALFPLWVACNNEEDDVVTMLGGYVAQTISLHIGFTDAADNDLVAPLDSYKSDGWVRLLPDDYTLDVYLDGKFVESSSEQHQNYSMCLIEDSPLKKGYKSFFLFSNKAEEGIMLGDYKSNHVIEFRFVCEALFEDSEEHVIRFEYLPPSPDTLVFDYKGIISLDGTVLDVVYPDDPERLEVQAGQSGQGLSVIATL